MLRLGCGLNAGSPVDGLCGGNGVVDDVCSGFFCTTVPSSIGATPNFMLGSGSGCGCGCGCGSGRGSGLTTGATSFTSFTATGAAFSCRVRDSWRTELPAACDDRICPRMRNTPL